jgi:hypothetical protein
MIKTNANNQAISDFLTTVFVMIHVFCHVLPFQLITSYRLRSIEDENASFLRNVGVLHYTLNNTRSQNNRILRKVY